MPFFRIALWIVLLVSAMLLPFLPGRHDPLAASLSVSAAVVCFGGLLLIPIGVVWLTFARQFRSPLIFILFVAAVLAVALGHHGDALVILAVVLTFHHCDGQLGEAALTLLKASKLLSEIAHVHEAGDRGASRSKSESDLT